MQTLCSRFKKWYEAYMTRTAAEEDQVGDSYDQMHKGFVRGVKRWITEKKNVS